MVYTLINDGICHYSGQNTVTTVMMNIAVDRSTDHAKPLSICFQPQNQHQIKGFFQCVTKITTGRRKQCCLYSYGEQQIGPSVCNITTHCG